MTKLSVFALRRGLLALAIVCGLVVAQSVFAQTGQDVAVMSDGQAYESYIAAPEAGGLYPGIVLVHSFNGLEEGYRTITDRFASEGYVVLAVGWQTFERGPDVGVVEQLMRDSIAFLRERDDVIADQIGLTGFCAGGRYTMRFIPLVEDFAAGVAWYGFPYSGEPTPASLVDQIEDPLLVIHGTADNPSPISDIYAYAQALDEAGAYFELKVYQGEPHGFMLVDGQLRTDPVADDAYTEMVDFFDRTLKGSM